MKKIITSLGMIVFVTAAVVGATGAFFNDTETSAGNVFTAGAIDLTVDSEAHYNGMICVPNTSTEQDKSDYYWQPEGEGTPQPYYPAQGAPCFGTWTATDLGAQTFFNYDDVKPGDEGENTISLHINSNPAWACVDVTLTENDDVSSNEPELAAGDATNTPDVMDGELAQNMKFAAWLDQGSTPGWQNSDDDTQNNDAGEGDNVWQGDPAEPLLFSNESGPASDVLGGKTYTLADSTTLGGPMQPNVTNYIGLQWCAGTQDVDNALEVITCDGSTLGNIVQTDSMEASIAFRVEQSRNNEDFRCNPREEELPNPVITLEKQVNQDGVNPVADSNWTLTATGPQVVTGTDNDPAESPAITNISVPVGDYVLTEEGEIAGFNFNGIQCTDGVLVGNTLTLALGDNAVCTFTNIEVQQETAPQI